jgi:hypothetical protein
VQDRYPGSTILRTGPADYHHTYARFAWRKVLADGSRLPEGLDVVQIGAEGRFRLVVGFFGALKRGSGQSAC